MSRRGVLAALKRERAEIEARERDLDDETKARILASLPACLRKYWTDDDARVVREHFPTIRPPREQRPRCGARRRDGQPCQAPAYWPKGTPAPKNGRCYMHGGKSTGPTTEEGAQRQAEASSEFMQRYWSLVRKARKAGLSVPSARKYARGQLSDPDET